jgi:hypothetical protein
VVIKVEHGDLVPHGGEDGVSIRSEELVPAPVHRAEQVGELEGKLHCCDGLCSAYIC